MAAEASGVSKTLIFSRLADRAFAGLPPDVQERLLDALLRYGETGLGDVKRMVGTPTVRLRSGDYRVIFDETADGVVILAVGHRREVYR